VVDHRRFGAMSSARAKRSGGRGGSHVWPTGPAVCAVAVCVGACASQPAALEAWRVLVWLITGKHGAEKREPGGLALFYNTPYDYMSLHLLVPFTYSVCTSCTVAPADALSTARRATRAGERDFAV